MGKIVALVDDLIFQSKLTETARQFGVEMKIVASGDALLAEVQSERPTLVIVDLNAKRGPIETLEKLKATGMTTRVVAFLSHVQTELAERARAAGCTDLLPRSKFVKELATLLERAKSEQS